MSKELEALMEIKRQVGNIHYFDFAQNPPRMTTTMLINTPFFDIIETALKDYGKLKDEYDKLESIYTHFIKQYNLLMKDHSNVLKALGIIKEKNINIYWLKTSANLSRYNLAVGNSQKLKKQDYELLKEVLL